MSKSLQCVLKLEHFVEAAEILRPFAHVTPVLTSAHLDELAGRELFFKCENFQKTGSFKFRGAMTAVTKYLQRCREDGAGDGGPVITHSSGNYGQALSISSRMKNVQGYVVMPRNAPSCKKAAVRGYGAEVHECEPSDGHRKAMAEQLQSEKGGVVLSSSQNYDVIAGNGTIALELFEQIADLDAIICPVGGGGLVSGVAIAAKILKPELKVYAAEPRQADDCHRSFTTGKLFQFETNPDTIADGLRVSIAEITFPLIRQYVEDVILVEESEIKKATHLVYERMKIVVETSSATALAAVLSDQFRALPSQIKRVAIVLTGGNVDLKTCPYFSA